MKTTIQKLREEIIKHTLLYEENRPTITDTEFDKMYWELIDLEQKYPEYYSAESPTQKIYTVVMKDLKQVNHSRPMISQKNITSENEIIKFQKIIDGNVLVQHKLDGLTIVIHYKKGKYYQAVTRGDGQVGEDVTHTIRTCSNIPMVLDTEEDLEIRGEAVIYLEDFNKFNIDGKYSNTRNLASGSVRKLDASQIKDRNLKFIAFDLVYTENKFKTDSEQLNYLAEKGFTVVESKLFTLSEIDKLVEYITLYNEQVRNTLDFVIDGLVLKSDDLAIRNTLGESSKYPRWACAFKFPSNDATTVLEDIKLSIGRTGQITPVGIFKAVTIDNVTIEKASLSNFKNIRDKDIRLGDKILVQRAKDVIPQIMKSFTEDRTESSTEYKLPTECPCCSSELVEKGDGILFCINSNCEETSIQKIIFYASKKAMNIEDLSEKTIEIFYKQGFLNNISDIYDLHEYKSQLLTLDNFGEKSINSILANIEKSKYTESYRLLTAMGIEKVGSSVAKKILEVVEIQELLTLDEESLYDRLILISGVGKVVVNKLNEFIANDENVATLEKLIAKMTFIVENKVVIDDVLNGGKYVITGKLSESKTTYKKTIESFGGELQSDIRKDTDFLVCNDLDSTSSKMTKAKKLNIPVITELKLQAKLGMV